MNEPLQRHVVPFIDDLGVDFRPEARGGAAVERKTSFLPRAGRQRLVAIGRAFHRSTTRAFCEGEVRDGHDRLIAKAMDTFQTIGRGEGCSASPSLRGRRPRGPARWRRLPSDDARLSRRPCAKTPRIPTT